MPFIELPARSAASAVEIEPRDSARTMYLKQRVEPREAVAAGLLSLPVLSALPGLAGDIADLAYPRKYMAEPGFEVRPDDLQGYEGYYHDLLGARSAAELLDRKRQVDARRRRRDALHYGGGWSVLGQILGAGVDPLSAVGAAVVGRGSLVGAGALGGAAAAGEVLAANEDPDLTAGDALLNIAIGTVAGHVLGAMRGVAPATAYSLGRRYADEMDVAERAADGRLRPGVLDPRQVREPLKPGILDPAEVRDPVKPGLIDPAQARDPVKPGLIDPAQATPLDGVGAAAVHGGAAAFPGLSGAERRAAAAARLNEMLENEGMVTAFGLERLNDNPVKRLLKSKSLAARDAIARLTEIPFLQNKNRQGGATYVSAWQKYRRRRGELARAMQETEAQYFLYRQRLAADGRQVSRNPLWQGARDVLQGRGDALSFGEFRVQVGWAKSRLDDAEPLAGAVPEAVAAARAWEARVYGPLGRDADELDLFTYRLRRQKQAVEARLAQARAADTIQELQEQVAGLERRIQAARRGVQKAGYVNRIYLVPEILARRADFRAILQSHLRLDAKQADALIDDIVRRSHYSPIDADATGEAASLKARTLRDIPDEALDGFIERDIYALGQRYHRTMGTDVELAREFGGEIDLRSVRDEIKAEYEARMAREPDAARKDKLGRHLERDLQDLVDVRDMYRGTFGIADDPTRFTSRAIRLAKYWNTLTQLTGAVAALPDIGRLVMRHGLERSLGSGLAPLFRNIEAYRLAKHEVNLAGEALDMYLGVRAAAFADIADTFATSSRLERAAGKAADLSFAFNLMNQWTDAIKSVTSMIAGTRILEDAAAWAAGAVDDAGRARLASLGIDEDLARRIAGEAGRHGTRFDRVRIANTDLWRDRAAADAFHDALGKDVNIAIVTPAPGERATWTSTEWGALVTQFKGFGMAATQRVLMAGLQERNADFVAGAALMVGLGALLDRIRRWQKDDRRELSFGEQLGNAIDRSGVLGWFLDVNNGVERLTDNQVGLGPLLGAEAGTSRPLQRLAGVAGPTAVTLDNLTMALTAAGDERALRARALRRLLPLNNAWHADALFDRIEEAAKP